MPSFSHFMITFDWAVLVSLLNNLTFKCQRISLAFLTRYGRVMPSTYHEVIRLCIHDKKLSFMTSQVCDPEFSVRDLQIRIYTYDTYECMIWIYVSIPVLDMYCLIMCLAEQHASPEFQNDSLAQTRLIRSSESAHMHIAPQYARIPWYVVWAMKYTPIPIIPSQCAIWIYLVI